MLVFSGKAALAEKIGERIFYRDLNPVDPALPRFAEAVRALGLQLSFPPRKTSEDYAKIIWHDLKLSADRPPEQILFFGDTPGNDGSVVRNLQKLSGTRVFGFIGSEKADEPPLLEEKPPLFLANRWELVAQFLCKLPDFGFDPEAPTALLFDMDKTLIGARGRNDAQIDAARMAGVRNLIRETLSELWDDERFLFVYRTFNQSEYHFLTEDNQDYLAFVCLMVMAGVWDFDELLGLLIQQKITSFEDFLNRTSSRILRAPNAGLQRYFEEVLTGTSAGDPTPFKSFRFKEYEATVARMNATESTDPRELVQQEILFTKELVDTLAFLQKKPNMTPVFCISDKPPESTFPPPELVAQGARPLHEIPLKIVGADVREKLHSCW